MQFRRAHHLLTLLLTAFMTLGTGGGARADGLDGLLEVRSAYVNVEGQVFQLFARIAYPVNDDIRAALKDGLTLTFDLDIIVARERRFWVDDDIYNQTITREVDSRNNNAQHSYATLEEALEALGTVDTFPILVSSQVSPSREYRVSLRAGVRRGKLPDTLRVLLFWTDDWHRESEWFSWSLQR